MKQIDHLLCFSLLYIVLVKVSQVKVPYRLPSRFWLLLLLIPVTLFIYLSIFRLCHRDSDTFEASLTSGSVQNLNKTDSKSSILSRISDTATICSLFSKEFAPSARSCINTFNNVYFKKNLFFLIPKSLSIGWIPHNSLAISETLPMKLSAYYNLSNACDPLS
ncbi:platelet endothelial aggregation receptor 1-like isoform X2 [Biomphalaria pfeifferi]|uniref:Platelet endothelial aggregation receptor 1-like isoform X2 n=1 Tax=Biomphalaria pfeifferi TaxID=112525 RepID=A0AAD8BVI9_BIOPF|nr:platelet endothelial aggregation receptor 1-like isoform X2 [Biomphalaria pfeifferi]